MTRRALLQRLDVPALEAAIARAERTTSGEIRVSIAPWFWGSVRRAAERAFERLGMRATRERNGALIFVVPARRRVVVIGDEGIHAHVGQQYWDEVAREVGDAFHDQRYSDGLLRAIEILGEHLARHFPSNPNDNPDELPNAVDGAGGPVQQGSGPRLR
jgi:uncharacterized membrane protein